MSYFDDPRFAKDIDLLARNVDRGEVLLDEVAPGWYKRINLGEFDMSSGRSCICGWAFREQLEELKQMAAQDEDVDAMPIPDDGYDYFVQRYEGLDNFTGSRLGFLTSEKCSIPAGNQWGVLGDLWVLKIEKRLAEDGLMA